MLKWAIIGSGDVVDRLVQKSFLIKNISKVVSIYSDNYKQANLLAKKHNLGTATKSLESIILSKEINSIYIATPPSSHAYYIKIFANNKKNILCEKPLAIKEKELLDIVKICKENRVSLITSFYRRYLKRFIEIKNIIENDNIGKIITFNYRLFHSPKNHPTAPINNMNTKNTEWRFIKKISGGGNFIDMGGHALDMIAYLMGDIKKIQLMKKNYLKLYNVEDTLITNIELKNKIIGQAAWSSVTNKTEDIFEIFGSKGTLSFSLNFDDKVIIKLKNKKIIKKIPFNKPFHKNLIKNTIDKFTKYNKQKIFKIEKFGLNVARHQIISINQND